MRRIVNGGSRVKLIWGIVTLVSLLIAVVMIIRGDVGL